MATTTSTSPLNGALPSGTLPITSAGVQGGTASMPVFAGTPDGTKVGIFLAPSVDFIGGFVLQRHSTGYQAGATDQPQSVVRGDEKFIAFAGPGPIASLSGQNTVTLVLTSYAAGSLTLSVVQ